MVWAGRCEAALEYGTCAPPNNTLPILCCKCRLVLWANCHIYAAQINTATPTHSPLDGVSLY